MYGFSRVEPGFMLTCHSQIADAFVEKNIVATWLRTRSDLLLLGSSMLALFHEEATFEIGLRVIQHLSRRVSQ